VHYVRGVKKNIDGKLYTYAYGLLTAASLDLIEEKSPCPARIYVTIDIAA
jgi:hypothetical protein